MAYLWIPLEDDDPAALVAGCEEVAVLVELDAGDDVGLCDVIVEGALHLREAPLHLARRRAWIDKGLSLTHALMYSSVGITLHI